LFHQQRQSWRCPAALIEVPHDETQGRFVQFTADNETEIDAVLGKAGTGQI